MTELKITGLGLGPWRVEESGGDYHFLLKGGDVFYIPEDQQDSLKDLAELIAAMAALGDYDESRANAHLISASPHLYEALYNLRNRVKYDKDASDWWPDAQEQADAALAKARGEEQSQ